MPGKLSAYLVDAETAELHEQLSDGQRTHDLVLARENLYGELLDVGNDEAFELAEQVIASYERLWSELTHEEVVRADERFRLEERLRAAERARLRRAEIELLRQRGRLPAAASFAESSSRAITGDGCCS